MVKGAQNNPVVFDISPEISSDLAVFPGDTAFSRTLALDFSKGQNLRLSSMNTTVHIGAHADAPSHYHLNGETIEARSLDYFLGTCQVIEVTVAAGSRLGPEDLRKTDINAKRVLIKTGSFHDPNHWREDFVALSAALVHWLHEKGVVTVGVDTPSVDLAKDQKLEAHQAVYQNNMAILEGLVLDGVPEGLYTLIALPLKIRGADASPVRAVLLKDHH